LLNKYFQVTVQKYVEVPQTVERVNYVTTERVEEEIVEVRAGNSVKIR
jgi:hypothetical protein